MDFFDALDTEKRTTGPNTLKGHDRDLSVAETQPLTQANDEEDSYTSYQRELILGLDDANEDQETQQTPADTSYMAGIRRRLLEKRKLEAKNKSEVTTQQTQQIKSTQVISSFETQAIDTQVVETQQSVTQAVVNSSKETQLIESSTQTVRTQAVGEEDSEDEVVTVRRKTVINSDDEEEVFPTQKIMRNDMLDSENEEDGVAFPKKKVSFIGSEDDNYDDDESPKNKFSYSDMHKTDAEKHLEETVMKGLFGDVETKNKGEAVTDDITQKIQNYHTMSKEERIKARAEAHRLAREEKENAENSLLGQEESAEGHTEPAIGEVSKDTQFVSEFNKKQDKKAKAYQKMKLKERRERAEQAKLIQQAADAILNFDPSSLTKDKLLAQLTAESDSEDVISENKPNTIKASPVKQATPVKKTSLASRTIVRTNILPGARAVELDLDGSDSSDSDQDNAKDKLRLLELKRKMVKRNKEKKNLLHRESSLDEKIKKQIDKQKRKPGKRRKPEEEEMTTEEMVVELLHRDQMRDAENFKRQERERKQKAKQQEMMKNGIFPSHDDDPEFSQSSEGESENEADNMALSQRQEPIQEEDSEEVHTVSPDLEQLNFKTTQTDEFKKLGISMTQLFNNGTQKNEDNRLTAAEKFHALKGDIEGLQKIDESNESIMELTSNGHNNTMGSSFLSKMVADDSMTFSQSQHRKEPSDLNKILGTQTEELSTQVDASTQVDLVTEDNNNGEAGAEIDEDDDDDDEKITIGRKRISTDDNSDAAVASEEELEDETEEEKAQRRSLMKLMKEQERKLRMEREKKIKEMGLGKMMENEADESEDEFKGVGGEDGEASDVENSDDERMIDDARNVKLNATEIRQKVLEKELEEDKALVERTYKDVKTHKLRERRAKDGVYDMELSDEDDDEYFKLKLLVRQQMEKKQMEFEGRNKVDLSENNPQKPFFDAMAVKLPSRVLSFKREKSSPSILSELVSDDESAPSEDKVSNGESLKRRSESPSDVNKRMKIPEPQELDIDSLQERDTRDIARARVLEELSSDDEDGSSALKRIKSSSTIKLSRHNSYRRASQQATLEQTVEDDVDTYSMLASRTTSVTSSFKKATARTVRKGMFTGNIVREVTVTTNSRSVLNSKSAVTKMVSKDVDPENDKPFDETADRMSSLLAASRKKGIRKLGTSKFRR